MNNNTTTIPTMGGQNDNHARDCDRCGRTRPADTKRFTVTASDHTSATVAYEKVLLCGQCWKQIRDDLRRER